MLQPGDVISYLEMCQGEGTSLQRGMNFQLRGGLSVILMSLRPGAPYSDRVEENGRILIYEGHDMARSASGSDPKLVDQPDVTLGGGFTQNGLFFRAALDYKLRGKAPELVKVYEKIRSGIWVYNGIFRLVDAWQEVSGPRLVYKFKLELYADPFSPNPAEKQDLDHNRVIPTSVKLAVWKRDKGKCVTCGSQDNVHFDHIIPFSRGGSSLVPENIQPLCARHNLQKGNHII